MKKFTKSISSVIVLFLLLGNHAFSKNKSFFENTKTNWAKKGFSSTIAKPDFKLANISVVLLTCSQTGTVTLTNTNTVTFTATTTLATSTATATATSSFSTGTQTITLSNTATSTSTVSSSTNTSTSTSTGTTTFNFGPPVLGSPSVALTGITIPITSVPAGTLNYDVYKSIAGAAYIKINASPQTNFSSYFDSFSPLAATNYSYLVQARNAAGCLSDFSSSAATTTNALPKAIPTATALSPTNIYVQWPIVAGCEGYDLLRSQDGLNYVSINISGPTQNNFSDGFNQPKLNPNTKYYYIVKTRFPNGFSLSDAVSATTPGLPVPTIGTATANDCSRITVTWTDPSPVGFAEEEFRLYRSENGGTFVEVARPAANATSYQDQNLKPNTAYGYQVAALYSGGLLSGRSSTASASTAPIVLSLVQNSATTADIKWGLCTPFTQGWIVYLVTGAGAPVEAGRVGPQVDKFSFKNLMPQTKYSVYIVNYFNNGIGGSSNTLTFTTPKFPGPSNLTVFPGTDNLKVNWTDNSNGPDNEDAFILFRSIDNGANYTQIILPPVLTEYVDKNLKPSQKVCYYVEARFFNGLSDPSNTKCEATCPAALTEFTKVEAVSTTQINLEWAQPDNSGGESFITIEHSFDGITFSKLADVPGTTTSYKDISLLPNQKKYYRANVKNSGSCSSIYSLVGSTTSCPLAPTNVVAKTASSSSVDVTWDLGDNMKAYIIERSTDNIDFVKAGEVDGKLAKFIDTKLASSKKYYYRVFAKNEGCTSAASTVRQESTATTCASPPSNLVAVANSAKEIKITFTDNSPDESGFEVEWSKDEKTWAKVGATLPANTTSATYSTGIDAETKYSFRVRALGEVCNSDYSNIASVTTNPAAPTNLTAKGVKINQIDLAWTNTSKIATGIEIQRAAGADNNFTEISKEVVSKTTYSNTPLAPATTYKYKVRYSSPNGFSDWSNIAEGTTLVISANEDNTLAKQITLFPVPTDQTLFIKPTGNILGKVSTKIVNTAGSTLIIQDFNGLVEGKTEQINVSTLGTGIYFLEISTVKGSATKKFMKR